MSCSFCPGTSRPDGFMGRGLFEKIMRETQNRVLHTYFHVLGEPLIHPEIGAFLDIAADYGHRVSITTSGKLVSNMECLLYKKALRNINFSLHSAEAGCNSAYLERIFSFTRIALAARIPVSFRLWNNNGSTLGNDDVLFAIEKAFCPGMKLDATNTGVRGLKIADRLFLNIADKFHWPSLSDPEIPGTAYCKGMREQAAILCDGTVTACCLDKDGAIRLGNINEASFEIITGSARAKAVGESFGLRKCSEDLCKRCTFRLRFKC